MKTYDPLGNITTAGTSQATSTQVTAPTSYWKYDESSGVASDSTGSNTLTNNNTITYSAGKTNNASNLVAANSQWFSIANGTWSNLDPTTSFSLSFWLKLTSLPGSGEYSVISKTDGSAADYRVMIGGTAFGNNGIYALWTDNGSFASSQAHLGEYDGPANYFTSDDVGTWVHVTIVADATNQTVVAYKNGQPTTLTKRGSSNASSISQSAVRFDVGRIGTIKHLDGSLDEMRFWKNYKLTSTEISALYSGTNIGGTTYTYEGTGYANPDAPTSIGTGVATTTYAYDLNGNLASTTGATTTAYTWDYANRLISSWVNNATSSYGYDVAGNRVFQIIAGATTTYPNKYYTISGATTTANIFLPDGTLVAYVEANGSATSTFYVHPDHLGSTNVITTASGAVQAASDYYPYGAKRIDTAPNQFDRQFIGERFDSSSGLNYLQQRYYDGARGQFTSQDPEFLRVGSGDLQGGAKLNRMLSDPQRLNSYSYAGGNPITNKDPGGDDYYHFDNGNVMQMAPMNRNNNYYQQMDTAQLNLNRSLGESNRGNLALFYVQVNTGGDWDYKNNSEGRQYYFYNGELVTSEEYGNLHYGDTGTAFGIGRRVLTDAAGANQIQQAGKQNKGPTLSNWNGNFDDPRDTTNINIGINTYNNANRPNSSTAYANTTNAVYSGSGTAGLVRSLSALVAALSSLVASMSSR